MRLLSSMLPRISTFGLNRTMATSSLVKSNCPQAAVNQTICPVVGHAERKLNSDLSAITRAQVVLCASSLASLLIAGRLNPCDTWEWSPGAQAAVYGIIFATGTSAASFLVRLCFPRTETDNLVCVAGLKTCGCLTAYLAFMETGLIGLTFMSLSVMVGLASISLVTMQVASGGPYGRIHLAYWSMFVCTVL